MMGGERVTDAFVPALDRHPVEPATRAGRFTDERVHGMRHKVFLFLRPSCHDPVGIPVLPMPCPCPVPRRSKPRRAAERSHITAEMSAVWGGWIPFYALSMEMALYEPGLGILQQPRHGFRVGG